MDSSEDGSSIDDAMSVDGSAGGESENENSANSGDSSADGSDGAVDYLSMGSDGSDYVYEGTEGEHDDIEYTWDDDEDEPPPVLFTRLGLCADGLTDWDEFLQRLRDYPEERYRICALKHPFLPQEMPTILHEMIRYLNVPKRVQIAVLEACPEAARIDPFPIGDISARMGEGDSIFEPELVQRIHDAFPEPISQRHFFGDASNRSWPLHNLCHIGTVEGATKAQIESCVKIIEFLLDRYPEMILERHNGRLPLHCLSKGRAWIGMRGELIPSNEREGLSEDVWRVYILILRATCRALYSMKSAPDEEVDKLLLHTAVELKVPADVVQTLVEMDPSAVSRLTKSEMLPLHIAAKIGFEWASLKSILDAQPRALAVRDVNTMLYPFMLAAMDKKEDIDNARDDAHATRRAARGLEHLEALYRLLREDPILAGGMVEEAPGVRIWKRICLLEKERDGAIWERDAALEKCRALEVEVEGLKAKLAKIEG